MPQRLLRALGFHPSSMTYIACTRSGLGHFLPAAMNASVQNGSLSACRSLFLWSCTWTRDVAISRLMMWLGVDCRTIHHPDMSPLPGLRIGIPVPDR